MYMEHISRIPVSSDGLRTRASRDVRHLPGPRGHWFWGNSRDFLPNPGFHIRNLRVRYGDCFTVGVLGNRRQVILVGPRANRLVLIDSDDNFSARWGWEVVHPHFPGMVLLRDFADHRQHRRFMTPLFKPAALSQYLGQMDPIIREAVETWHGNVDIYRAQKQLTLDIALRVFGGIKSGPTSATLNRDLTTVLDNVMALPGARRWRGLRARDRLRTALREELQVRRTAGGRDLFSRLTTQRDDAGRTLSDTDVVDHMLGLLFAAHDTTASALTTICMQLARFAAWQDHLRQECRALWENTRCEGLTYALIDQLPLIEAFFRETLRQYSPLQIVPRRSVREFVFDNYRIPANAPILLFPQATHFDPEFFPEPERFDPMRFIDSGSQDPFAFIPFGRGSHMCLGMHFASMEVKAVLYRLLLSREVRFAHGDDHALNYVPIVRPLKPVRLRLQSLRRQGSQEVPRATTPERTSAKPVS